MNNFLNTPLSRRAVLAGLALAPLGLAGCAGNNESNTGSAGNSTSGDSTGFTMLTASGSYQAFSEALTAAHPDVKLDMVSYAGKNTTDYIKAQMEAEQCPDIVINTYPNSGELQQANLYDLSGESFTNNIRTKLLDEVSVDGAVYLIPSNVSFFGPFYNETLFDAHGWALPNSMAELEELVPKIKEAGVTLAEVTTQYPGTAFAMFFDILAPSFFTTLEGQTWRTDFLAGNAKATGTLEPYIERLQKLIDLGFFEHVDPNLVKDAEARDRYDEGNTAFLVTTSAMTFGTSANSSGDTHKLMPWLSDDGYNNIIVTNVNRYYGLNKNVADDADKLARGLELMDFLASEEGQQALATNTTTISPIKGSTVAEDNPVHDVASLVDEGKSMAMVYTGWEDYVVDLGNFMLSVFKGEASAAEIPAKFDELQASIANAGGAAVYAEVAEDLGLEQVAQVVGAAYAEAAGTECALISLGAFHSFSNENKDGINGNLYAGVKLTESMICTVNPLGWNDTVKTLEVDGKTINAWVEEGYLRSSEDGTLADDEPYEYVLVTKGGAALEEGTTYKVALATESAERAEQGGGLVDTGATGQDAIIDYVSKLGTLDSKSIVWA